MNKNQFLELTSVEEIQALKPDEYPSWANVTTHLNKHPECSINKLLVDWVGETKLERLFNLLNNKRVVPKCNCGNKLPFKGMKIGYLAFCSHKCLEADPTAHNKILNKRQQTNLKRFGVKNAGENEIIKQKIAKTMTVRYGKATALAVPEFIEKSKTTRKKNQAQTTAKIRKINLEKYGVPCTLHAPGAQDKIKQTFLRKYGVEHSSQIPSVKEAKRLQLQAYRKRSKFEEEICKVIEDLGYKGQIIRNTRAIITPMELDIWLPDVGLGIECNGCYWHSDPWKPQDYHLVKTEAVEEQGFKLIHLFDLEWKFKREIIIERLKNLLNLSPKIYARNCVVKPVKYSQLKEFFLTNHLQGTAVGKHNYGLFYNDQLVAGMNFSKPRFNKAYDHELIRYASLGTVIGGAGKLLKAFIRDHQPGSIITYADRRWSNGDLYEKLGFQLLRKSKPGYWYFKDSGLMHRTTFQKHKQSELLPIFDPELGEVENMYLNRWRRVFDSGARVYTISLN